MLALIALPSVNHMFSQDTLNTFPLVLTAAITASHRGGKLILHIVF